MTLKKKILKYQFEDSKQIIFATIIGNVALGLILLLPDFAGVLQNVRAQICLITGFALLVVGRIYDWKSSSINIIISLLYLGLVILEITGLGLPASPIAYDVDRHQVSKGIMFDMLVWLLPSLYMASRILLSIPLILMVKASKKIKS